MTQFTMNNKKDINHQKIQICQYCTKMFTNFTTYQTHMKIKHKDIKINENKIEQNDKKYNNNSNNNSNKIKQNKNKNKNNKQSKQQQQQYQDSSYSGNSRLKKSLTKSQCKIKNSPLETQQNQLQDNIYAYLGQLGEKNIEICSIKPQSILQSSDQRMTGQANYSLNKVVRTPYQDPIKPLDFIPYQTIENCQYKELLITLHHQLKELQIKIQAERQLWQLRDPMAPDEETQNQFSLMDINKLIQNYNRRQLHLLYPCFSIFLLWVSRICKPPAFQQFYIILGHYLGKYLSYSKQNQYKKYNNWQSFQQKWQQEELNQQLKKHLNLCDQKSCRKLCQYFNHWVKLFSALVI